MANTTSMQPHTIIVLAGTYQASFRQMSGGKHQGKAVGLRASRLSSNISDWGDRFDDDKSSHTGLPN